MSDQQARNEGIDLEDHANLSNVPDETDRLSSGPGRSSLLADALGISVEQIEVVREGGYQGTILFVFRHEGYLWLLKSSYGSCSGCDGLLSAKRGGSLRDYTRSMLRNAYAFSDDNEAVRFLHEKSEESPGHNSRTFAYGWGPLVDEGIELIEEV